MLSEAYAAAREVVESPSRLAAVRSSGLLDSEVEEAFDRLTRLAVRLLDIPAAFVSLVDENRDFYKSACGFGEPLATARELSGPTFCHFTIQSLEPLVIPDTRADPNFCDVPTVQSLGVAAYVGIPIQINGEVIGAFCAIDMEPRPWSDQEIGVLTELAAVAVSEISLRSARMESERYRRRAEALVTEQELARRDLQVKTEELFEAHAEVERANAAKGEFLAALSHDLRTPLNAIGGFAELIEIGVHGEPTDGQRSAAQAIIRAQRHLSTLISDILNFVKADSGDIQLDPHPVSVSDILGTVDTLLCVMAGEEGVSLRTTEPENPLWVYADEDRVVQILVNLGTNGVKFTPDGGEVRLEASSDGEWTSFAVSDTGPGIDPDQWDRIFTPFVQVGTTDSRKSGLGLGLATSRVLARRMGGDVFVESGSRGARLVLRLPSRAPHEAG